MGEAPRTACLDGIDVVILAGGLGTRIAGILGDTPKIMAPIGGVPFLEYILDWLADAGARSVILSLGHLADKVVEYLKDCPARDLSVDWVVETRPLGTAGGLRQALPKVVSRLVLAMNGDSWTGIDLCAFVAAHRRSGAPVSMLCVEVEDTSRFGRVEIGGGGRVARFVEKNAAYPGAGFVNAGVYLFSPDGLDLLARSEGPQLERDFLQTLPAGTIHAYAARAKFIDIGTPASLALALGVLGKRDGDRRHPPRKQAS